jgi:desulfoferrodoxin-like iron-binding protein
MFRCAVCGAEVTVLRPVAGDFKPVCCNRPMEPRDLRAVFYRCPVCGAEIAIINPGAPGFRPRCCNTDMERIAA